MRVIHQDGSCLARTSVLCYALRTSVLCYALMDPGGGAVQSLSSEEGYCQAIIRPDPRCVGAGSIRMDKTAVLRGLFRTDHRQLKLVGGEVSEAPRPELWILAGCSARTPL